MCCTVQAKPVFCKTVVESCSDWWHRNGLQSFTIYVCLFYFSTAWMSFIHLAFWRNVCTLLVFSYQGHRHTDTFTQRFARRYYESLISWDEPRWDKIWVHENDTKQGKILHYFLNFGTNYRSGKFVYYTTKSYKCKAIQVYLFKQILLYWIGFQCLHKVCLTWWTYNAFMIMCGDK